jgi:hypothetical protein
MSARFNTFRPAALALSASAIALGLSACKVDNRPLLARGEPAYSAGVQQISYPYDIDALGLPYAQPAQIMPVDNHYDGYALAERAYAYDRVAYRAPPDHAFRYGEVEPWAWRMADNSLMFAEPYGDDYRFYYYEPGDAYPYFVRDPYYGYAYGENGALLAVLDAAGALLSNTQLSALADIAGRYLHRGYGLRDVYYDAPHYAVAESVWIERAPILYAYQEPWIEVAQAHPVWTQYRASIDDRWYAAYQPERIRRERVAARYYDRVDWDEAGRYRKAADEWRKHRQEAWKDRREAVKEWRKDEREHAREARKDRREAIKETAKWEREQAKEQRKWREEQAKEAHKWREERARNAYDGGRPAFARGEEGGGRGDRGRDFARNEHRGGDDRGGWKGGGDDHKGRGHDGDHGKGRGGDGGKGHGGDGGGGKGGDGGKGKGKD